LANCEKRIFRQLKIRYEHEYITIQRETLGTPDDWGVRESTESDVYTNVKADIQAIKALSAQKLAMFNQGLVALSSHWMMVESDVDIQVRDQVVDVDDNEYDVQEVADWRTHQEVLLKIAERQ